MAVKIVGLGRAGRQGPAGAASRTGGEEIQRHGAAIQLHAARRTRRRAAHQRRKTGATQFPAAGSAKLADAVAVGDQITAEGTPERAEADHTVCRLQKLTTAKGKEIAFEGPPPRRRGPESEGRENGAPPTRERGSPSADRGSPSERGSPSAERGSPSERGPRSADAGPSRRGERTPEKSETVKGVVKYLNHGPRGEVDGAVLESGDFVHIGPREAEEAKLAVGQEISVEGQSMKMPDGHTMIEHPTKINDKEVNARPGPSSRCRPRRRPDAAARRRAAARCAPGKIVPR